MLRTILGGIAIIIVGTSILPAAIQEPAAAAPQAASTHRAMLNRYCVTCHNERLRTAELTLDKMDVERVSEGAEVWEKVLRKLRTGAMPPAGVPRPEPAAVSAFTAYLETELDRAATAMPDPGKHAVLHRLNRAEYSNAIRDLLAVEIEGASLLPADDSGKGFDNLADLLPVSPLLMERYLSAAGKVSRLAIADRGIAPVSETYAVSIQALQDDRMSDDLPFGSRGGVAARHYFPVDGEYTLKVRLQRDENGYIRGLLNGPHLLDARLDGARLRQFTIERAEGASGPLWTHNGPDHRGETEPYEYGADENLEVRFAAKAGTRVVGVAFLRDPSESEGILLPEPTYYDTVEYKGGDPDYKGGLIAVESVTITGPYNAQGMGDTPSRRKIFVCTPSRSAEEEACAEKILSTLARRAYRRPVADPDVQPLLHLYKTGRSAGGADEGFEAGVRAAVERILVSPQFLFRIERDPVPPTGAAPKTAARISDIELASRLSFFLWSSIPDDELLGLAEQGRLSDPALLAGQVRRMLADSRSKALVENFAGQWLFLRNVDAVSPDPKEFPDFNDNLREAFRQETEHFFANLLREDRPVLELLTANYTFVNERLARHYGIPNVYGSHFRRVPVTDETRHGLLGQGSILTVTSRANRTSPVLRGKWVLDNLLGTPPPPPPPNVPALKERGAEIQNLTMRQRMEQHRSNPVCASCHSRMDPIGFALDNFNPIGQWRTQDAGNPIDSSGAMADGTRFDGPVELRKALLKNPEQVVYTVAEKLLTYALGRDVEFYDAPALRRILREADPSEQRWSSLFVGIVQSTPFQMRRTHQP
jgi:cytochrome c5